MDVADLGEIVAGQAVRLWQEAQRAQTEAVLGGRSSLATSSGPYATKLSRVEANVARNIARSTGNELERTRKQERGPIVDAAAWILRRNPLDLQMLHDHDWNANRIGHFYDRVCEEATAEYLLSPGQESYLKAVLRSVVKSFLREVDKIPSAARLMMSELLTRASTIISTVADTAAGVDVAALDAHFLQRYRNAVGRSYGQVELFGVRLSERHKVLPLSVAYLSLDVRVRADDVFDGESSPLALASVRVDQLLPEVGNLLISGHAGTGKTTLLRWLMCETAQGSHTGEMATFNTMVPFFVPLRRTYFDLPKVGELAETTIQSLGDVVPRGWVSRQLHQGRGLVLVDGLDEVPVSERPRVGSWLKSLVDAYPEIRLIVTSRRAHGVESIARDVGLSQAAMQPMRLNDIDVFADHWHRAAAHATGNGVREDLISRFRKAIRASSALRTMATTPLLCAVLCALSLENNGVLPREKSELYRLAVDMLLWQRDAERLTDLPSPHLSKLHRESLARDIALWMLRNEQTDISVAAALDRVTRRLPTLHGVTCSPEAALGELLERSGVIREPEVGRVDFIHKTFMEYLAALELVDEAEFGFLASKGDDPDYRDVISLAAGAAHYRERQELVAGLLTEIEPLRPGQRYSTGEFTALSCLETSDRFDEEIRERLAEVADRLTPPHTPHEALQLAKSFGESAAWRFFNCAGLPEEIVCSCIRGLATIATPITLARLEEYVDDPRPAVISELFDAWEVQVDPAKYAADVLAKIASIPELPKIRSVEALQIAYEVLPRVESVDWVGDHSPEDCARVGDAGRLIHTASLRPARRSHNFEGNSLARLTSVRSVSLSGFGDVLSLEEVPSLEDLTVSDCSAAYLTLDGLEYLESVTVRGLRHLKEIHRAERDRLRSLTVENCPLLRAHRVRLSGLSRLRIHLQGGSAGLEGVNFYNGDDSLDDLISLDVAGLSIGVLPAPNLDDLVLRNAELSPSAWRHLENLRGVTFENCPMFDLRLLPSSIVELTIRGMLETEAEEALLFLPRLKKVDVGHGLMNPRLQERLVGQGVEVVAGEGRRSRRMPRHGHRP